MSGPGGVLTVEWSDAHHEPRTTRAASAMKFSGFTTSASAAAAAGALVGGTFGLIDGIVAASCGTASLSWITFPGCIAAAVLVYGVIATVGLLGAALALHPMLQHKPAGQRFAALLRVGFALGIFSEIYWWTRPYVFYGHSSAAPERLAAMGAMLLVATLLGYLAVRLVARYVAGVMGLVSGALVLAWIGGGVFLASEQDTLRGYGEPNERTRKLPNVLLVVVDALRQDTLGCYGHPDVKSPHIDALAANGVLFENAFTQAPFTWTSFGSLLTGKYPRRHGLVRMAPGVRMKPNVTLPWHLKRARTTKGADLVDKDWLNATFHTGTLSTGSGLLRGFDVYYEQLAGHDLVVTNSAWSVFRSDLLMFIFKDKLAQKVGSDVARTARAWLAENGRRRFCAMVHLYSTHTPYDPETAYRDLYADPGYSGPVKSFYAGDREAIESGKATPTAEDVEAIRRLYYAGVSQADARIGELLDELRRQKVLDDTLVIVVSDHGESLGEHGLWEHNHMVQTNLRIPLVLSWPNGLPRGVRVTGRVDEIDVLPTVCELLGLELPPQTDDYAKIDGVSLMPVVRGESSSVRAFSFAENGLSLSIQDDRFKLVVPRDLVKPEEWARGASKLGRPVLRDLRADPGEALNCILEHPAEVERLLEALRAYDVSMPYQGFELSGRDFDQVKLFDTLGYTGGVGESEDDGAPSGAKKE